MSNYVKSYCRLTDVESDVRQLREKLANLYDATGYAVHDEILRFSYQLELKYTRAKECMLFHLIIGGTLPPRAAIYDLPGSDSIERFVDKLYAKYYSTGVA